MPAVVMEPTLGIVLTATTAEISFDSEAGTTYRLESTTDLSTDPIVWSDEGTLTAAGSRSMFSVLLAGNQKFFRVVAE
jgi:hypothetical protein